MANLHEDSEIIEDDTEETKEEADGTGAGRLDTVAYIPIISKLHPSVRNTKDSQHCKSPVLHWLAGAVVVDGGEVCIKKNEFAFELVECFELNVRQ